MLETSHCGHIDARILFIGQLTNHCGHIDARILFIKRLASTLNNLSNRLRELWSVIFRVLVEKYVHVCERYFFNVESKHFFLLI